MSRQLLTECVQGLEEGSLISVYRQVRWKTDGKVSDAYRSRLSNVLYDEWETVMDKVLKCAVDEECKQEARTLDISFEEIIEQCLQDSNTRVAWFSRGRQSNSDFGPHVLTFPCSSQDYASILKNAKRTLNQVQAEHRSKQADLREVQFGWNQDFEALSQSSSGLLLSTKVLSQVDFDTAIFDILAKKTCNGGSSSSIVQMRFNANDFELVEGAGDDDDQFSLDGHFSRALLKFAQRSEDIDRDNGAWCVVRET